jgi:hypothetical protein
MAPGRWLVSLEFVVPERAPDLSCAAAARVVRAWRVPPRVAGGAATPAPRRRAGRSVLNQGRTAPITPGNAHAPSVRA